MKLYGRKFFSSSKWPIQWNLSSVWPKSLINNDVVIKLDESLKELSDNNWKINIQYGVNKNDAFAQVQEGKVDIIVGHSTYWPKLKPAATFFASVPFGMGSSEFSAWVAFGGGRKLWEQFYEPYGIFPLCAGDTGMQMGGWFANRINSTSDFKGLKMRVEGLGGPVLEKFGVKLIDAPANKLKSMLESGELDACEFATPAMDEAAGLHQLKKKLIYHYPGWHQPSAIFEFLINKKTLDNLSPQQVAMLKAAAHSASSYFNKKQLSNNELVLEKFVSQGIKLHQFPPELLKELQKVSREVLEETCSKDEFSKKVMTSYLDFLKRMTKWGPMSGSALWQWRSEGN